MSDTQNIDEKGDEDDDSEYGKDDEDDGGDGDGAGNKDKVSDNNEDKSGEDDGGKGGESIKLVIIAKVVKVMFSPPKLTIFEEIMEKFQFKYFG